MHSLSETLLAAQRDRAAIPYVHATLAERWGGVTQLRWERLASGQEPDGPHDAVITSGGSLIRVRAQADPNGLFIQRTASPGPDAQFGAWRNLGATSASGGIAVIEIGGQIHVFECDVTCGGFRHGRWSAGALRGINRRRSLNDQNGRNVVVGCRVD